MCSEVVGDTDAVVGEAEVERGLEGRAGVLQAGNVAQLAAGEAAVLERPDLVGRTDVHLGGKDKGLVGPGHALLGVSRI